MKKFILGVKVDDISMKDALDIVHDWLSKKEQKYIVTPNPEIIVSAQKDLRYKSILNDADLSIPDGAGLKLSGKVNNTFAGVDFMEELVKHSGDWGATIGFLGGRGRVAERTADCLKEKYPKLKVSYALEGPVIPAKAGIYTNKELWIPDQVRDDKVDLLFVGFGPPKQEYWISKNIKKLDIKVMMGVGGSLDYLSGKIPRAPKLLRSLGFEWLFRLIIQPWRIKRQLALIKYLFMLLWNHDNN